MYEIRSIATDKVLKSNIKTDVNAIAALIRMKNPDAVACTKGGGVLVMWTDDAGNCHRAKLCDF